VSDHSQTVRGARCIPPSTLSTTKNQPQEEDRSTITTVNDTDVSIAGKSRKSSGIAVGGDTFKNPFIEVFEDELTSIEHIGDFDQFSNSMASPGTQLLPHNIATPRASNLNKKFRATAASMAAALRSYTPRHHTNSNSHQNNNQDSPAQRQQGEDHLQPVTPLPHSGNTGRTTPMSERTKAFTQILYGNPHFQRVACGGRVICIATRNMSTYDDDTAHTNNGMVSSSDGGNGASGTLRNTNNNNFNPTTTPKRNSRYVQRACGEFNIHLPGIDEQRSSMSSMSGISHLPEQQLDAEAVVFVGDRPGEAVTGRLPLHQDDDGPNSQLA
jgi:hypothetical protein